MYICLCVAARLNSTTLDTTGDRQNLQHRSLTRPYLGHLDALSEVGVGLLEVGESLPPLLLFLRLVAEVQELDAAVVVGHHF